MTLARKQRLAAHAFTLGALVLWLVYSRIVPPYQMPGPAPVARDMVSFFADRLPLGQLLLSLGHVAAAIAVSFLLGVGIALFAHYLPVLRLLIYGRLTPFLNSFSGIGWTLLAVFWFGLNDVTELPSLEEFEKLAADAQPDLFAPPSEGAPAGEASVTESANAGSKESQPGESQFPEPSGTQAQEAPAPEPTDTSPQETLKD